MNDRLTYLGGEVVKTLREPVNLLSHVVGRGGHQRWVPQECRRCQCRTHIQAAAAANQHSHAHHLSLHLCKNLCFCVRCGIRCSSSSIYSLHGWPAIHPPTDGPPSQHSEGKSDGNVRTNTANPMEIDDPIQQVPTRVKRVNRYT